MNKKYHIVYKTTNQVNGKIYIGVHSTDDLDDNYMGSGVAINEAIKKYGKKSFLKEILFTFDVREDAFKKEAELVTDQFTESRDNYNISRGGIGSVSQNSVSKTSILLKDGSWIRKEDFDPSIHEAMSKGTIVVRDSKGNRTRVYKGDPRLESGELIPWNKGIEHDEASNRKRSNALKAKNWGRYCEVCNRHIGGRESNWNKHINSNGHINNL